MNYRLFVMNYEINYELWTMANFLYSLSDGKC